LESVFTRKGLESDPMANVSGFVSSARAGTAHDLNPALRLSAGRQEDLKELLRRINKYVMETRTEIIQPFTDFDTNRAGSMTIPQFERAMRVAAVKGVTPTDLELLKEAFRSGPGPTSRIQYRSFLNSLDAIDGIIGNLPEHGNGGAYANNDKFAYGGGSKPPNRGLIRQKGRIDIDALLDQMADFTANNHVRLIDFMVDYDPLRKGCLTQSKFRTAMNSAGFKLGISEMEVLEKEFQHYARSDMVEYDDLIRRIDPQLKKGMTRSVLAAADDGAKSVLAKLRDCIVQKRSLPKPYFQSHDKNHQGTVTERQFTSVLSFLKLLPILSEAEVKVICNRFRSKRDRDKIDYVRFCLAVDPVHQNLSK